MIELPDFTETLTIGDIEDDMSLYHAAVVRLCDLGAVWLRSTQTGGDSYQIDGWKVRPGLDS